MSEEDEEDEIDKLEVIELDKLEDYLLKDSPFTKRPFSDATKKSYRATYTKLRALLEEDINKSSQKRTLKIINELVDFIISFFIKILSHICLILLRNSLSISFKVS